MIAGAALVAAGEIAHVGQRAPAPGPNQPPAPLEIAANIPRDLELQPSVPETPAKAPDVSPRPSTGRAVGSRGDAKAHAVTTPNAMPTVRAGAASRSTTATRSPGRKVDEPRQARERDKSDRGLLRIRFVWNNPFR
jgi:hypothetical protein